METTISYPTCSNCHEKRTKTCGNCGRSWCGSCDPAPSALCHYCAGRGYSTHPIVPPGVYRRRFEATRFIKGSMARGALNLTCLTSEYMPSHRYCAVTTVSRFTFRTKAEAETFFHEQMRKGL